MLMDEYSYEEDIAVQRQEAEENGKEIGDEERLMKLVVRKLKRSFSLKKIAEEIEEPEAVILPFVKFAEKYAPEYNEEAILKAFAYESTK